MESINHKNKMEQFDHQLNLFDGLEFSYYVESLLERKESTSIEFKSAKGGFPKNFWETYSAFANTHGGIIVLGVKEDNSELVIEGLSDGQIRHYQKYFWDTINNKEYINLNLLRNNDVKEGVYREKKLLMFYIPQADRSQRPVHLTTNPFGHTFKRNHEGDYKCTNAEVKRMIADADISEPRDSKILKGFTIEDIDLDSVKQYRQLFSISKPNHTWLGLDDVELLKKLGGYRKERTTNEEGYTLAGLLMFGKMNAINDPHCAPNYFPDFRENLSADPDIRWTDRICYDGEWEANLFQFYRRVYNKLTRAIPSPFKISKGIRIDDSPTHVALREAFVNALVHCDYEAEGSIVIEQQKDKLIFSNPGTLMISISQYYQGGESVCRNPHLQQMFMLIGSAEKAGSGVSKILKGWKEARWKDPYIEDFTHPDKVKLTLPMVSLCDEEIIKELKLIFGSQQIDSLSSDEFLTLAACCSEGDISNDRLKVTINRHSFDITKLLKGLCQNGYIIPKGSGRGTKYFLNKNFQQGETDIQSNVERNIQSNVERNIQSNVERNIQSNVERNIQGTSDRKDILSTMEIKLLSECLDFMSVRDLALKLDRNPGYLASMIIPKLIRKGLLERLFPDVPRHRSQKYRLKIEVKNK